MAAQDAATCWKCDTKVPVKNLTQGGVYAPTPGNPLQCKDVKACAARRAAQYK